MFRLDGKTAVVTGAATGIGAGIAVMLAKQGAKVMILDKPGISVSGTIENIRSLSGQVSSIEIDIRDLDQIKKGVNLIRQELGAVDILVNNAGINRPAPGLEVTEELWDDHFNTNLKGGFFLTQSLVTDMIEKGWGRIIWISSQSGLIAIPGQPVYCSSKGAVIQLVRTLAVEWAKHGITVNSVAPTFIETNMTRKRLQNPEFLKFVLGKIPANRIAEVEDVGAAVLFLASQESGMVNGHTLSVDGGWTVW